MSFIEGIGDEVILFFVIVIVFSLAALITLIGSNPSLSRTRQRWRATPELGNEALRETVIQRRRVSGSRHSPISQAINELENNESHINNVDILDNLSNNQTIENTNINSEIETEVSTNNDQSRLEDITSVSNDRTDRHEDTEQRNPESSPASLEDGVMEECEQPHIPPNEIRVRLKYLDDTEKTVTTSLNTNIGDFKKKHFEDDIRSNKVIRLIFAGHLLNNSSTIEHCRILDNSVVHVQVLSAPVTQNAPVVNQETELDLSWILWPVLTVILSLCWLTYFKYPEFYNFLSLGVLLLFSGCYFYFLSQVRH